MSFRAWTSSRSSLAPTGNLQHKRRPNKMEEEEEECRKVSSAESVRDKKLASSCVSATMPECLELFTKHLTAGQRD